jgi:hypothetical protein
MVIRFPVPNNLILKLYPNLKLFVKNIESFQNCGFWICCFRICSQWLFIQQSFIVAIFVQKFEDLVDKTALIKSLKEPEDKIGEPSPIRGNKFSHLSLEEIKSHWLQILKQDKTVTVKIVSLHCNIPPDQTENI